MRPWPSSARCRSRSSRAGREPPARGRRPRRKRADDRGHSSRGGGAMTESNDIGPHPDLDRIAEFDVGDTDDAQLGAHLNDCSICLRSLAAVRAARSEVADLPTLTMPADVADRIDAALTEELRTSASAPPPAGNVVPISRVSRARGGMLAGGVAAAVVAALITVLFV